MKFPIVKSYNPEVISIKNFDGGLDKSAENTKIEDNCLADCKNVFYDENKLKTRPGLFSDENKCLKSSVTNTTFYSNFCVSDTKVFLGNTCYRIAIEYAETFQSNESDKDNCFGFCGDYSAGHAAFRQGHRRCGINSGADCGDLRRRVV